MTVWYVHRRQDGSIQSAHEEPQPGYAEEWLDDATNAEIIAYRAAVAPPAPIRVSSLQFKLALEHFGWLTDVEAAIAASDRPTQIVWQEMRWVYSNDARIAALAAALGKSPSDAAAVFAFAQAIP